MLLALVITVSCISVNAYNVETDIFYLGYDVALIKGSNAQIDTPKRINGADALYVREFIPNSKVTHLTAEQIIANYNSIYDASFPNATRLYTATFNFNCHSYA